MPEIYCMHTSIALPVTAQGRIAIRAPSDFNEVRIANSVLLSKQTERRMVVYTFSVPVNGHSVTVIYIPPTKRLPENFTLLKVEGNGITGWQTEGDSLIAIALPFEISGMYNLGLIGECTADSIASIPQFTVYEAHAKNTESERQ